MAAPDFSTADRLQGTLRGAPSDAPLVLDFDHTLFLPNSTEAYLGSLRPRALAALLLAVLAFTRPWRVMRGSKNEFVYKDPFRVVACTILLPWSAWLWRRRFAQDASARLNPELCEIARRHAGPVFVATNGFRFIVAPILAASGLELAGLCAASFWGGPKLRRGKAAALAREFPGLDLAGSIFVTDSTDDGDCLELAAWPALIEWPNAQPRRALQHTYLPFIYTELAKPAEGRFGIREVATDFGVMLLLAYGLSAPLALLPLGALFMLFVSMWCIYELGYRENDFQAAKREREPRVSEHLDALREFPMSPHAWLWAAALGALGGAAAFWGSEGPDVFVRTWIVWMGFLLVLRATYRVHNSIDVGMRPFVYPLLQLQKTLGFALWLPLSPVGLALLLAHAGSATLRYWSYRRGLRHAWIQRLSRLPLMLGLTLIMVATHYDPSLLLGAQFWIIVIWIGLHGVFARHR